MPMPYPHDYGRGKPGLHPLRSLHARSPRLSKRGRPRALLLGEVSIWTDRPIAVAVDVMCESAHDGVGGCLHDVRIVAEFRLHAPNRSLRRARAENRWARQQGTRVQGSGRFGWGLDIGWQVPRRKIASMSDSRTWQAAPVHSNLKLADQGRSVRCVRVSSVEGLDS